MDYLISLMMIWMNYWECRKLYVFQGGVMELLLNEKSLDGQFTNLDDFYEVLPVMSSNLRILRKYGIPQIGRASCRERV